MHTDAQLSVGTLKFHHSHYYSLHFISFHLISSSHLFYEEIAILHTRQDKSDLFKPHYPYASVPSVPPLLNLFLCLPYCSSDPNTRHMSSRKPNRPNLMWTVICKGRMTVSKCGANNRPIFTSVLRTHCHVCLWSCHHVKLDSASC